MLEGTETREASAAGESVEAVDAAEAAANGVTIVDGRLQEIAFPELGFSMRFVDAHELTGPQIDEAVELLRLAFNGGPGWFSLPVRQADHLRWKLVDPPFDSSVALFEDETGRLVGFTGILDRQWRVRGQDRTGRDGVELALHPDHQGGGLFRKLMGLRDLVPDDSDFWLAFSSHPGLKKVRPPEVELLANEIDNLVRPLSVTRYVRQREDLSARPTTSRTRIAIESAERRRRRRPKIVKWAAWQSRMLRQRLRYRPLRFGRPNFAIRTVASFDDRIDAFCEEASRPFVLIQRRNQATLNWRYADERGGPFTVRIAEEDGRLVGYAVTRAMKSGAELADLLVLPGRDDVANALIGDALDVGRGAGAAAMRAWMMEHHPYHRLLLHHGFVPVRRIVEATFEHRGNEHDLYTFVRDPWAPIHLMLGDTDHV